MRISSLFRTPLLLILLAAACGGPREVVREVTVEVPVTVIVAATIAPTQAPTMAPATMTPTPAPTPAPTAAPTAAPTMTPAPAAGRFTADDVVAAFRAAGLEVGEVRPLTRDDYQMAPLVGSGLRFLIPSLCEDCGGRVFAVEDAAEREALANYYRDLPKLSAILFSWVYVRDNIVLQINGDLPDEQALETLR